MTNIILHSLQPNDLKTLIKDSILEALENTNPQQPEKEDQLIKISEACRLLGVSSVTIHTWKKGGLIPFYRISNKIYFKKNELIQSLKKANRGVKWMSI